MLGDPDAVVTSAPGGLANPRTAGATPTGWYGGWLNDGTGEITMEVYVVCVSP